ncbi:HAD-IIB family hydrolase [Rothia sp. CCM 9416]|uniref:HAD-IIB family hydrolase n=1 Tax=Rothia sp. CCM 9416 TaxID=3402655 RepID=UPI003AEEA09E
MIKLIASDLDGTLIGHDFRFRPRTLEALHLAADAGIQIVFVTGRPLRWMQPVLEQLGSEWNGENSFVFCSNGAVTYDIGQGKVLATRTMSGTETQALHSELERVFPGSLFIAETLDQVYVQGKYRPHEQEDSTKIVEGPIGRTLDSEAGVVKYLLYREGAAPSALLDQVRDVVGERAAVTRSAPYQPLVELARKGLNKGCVLADFAAEHSIRSDEVLAFGDMPNDLEMLTWAGKGYAMESGLPQLKEQVGRTCPGFDQDGVAQVIEGILAHPSEDLI